METSYNKVIQEFNYDKLQLVQKEVLEHELKEKDGIIDYLSSSWWMMSMEGISAFGIGSPPKTPPMKSCLDNEVIFDTDDTCNDDST